MLWEDIQRSAAYAEKKEKDPDSLVCPKCGSNFFSVEEYKQYRVDKNVCLCQRPANHPKSPTFYFFRCICGEIIEPPISTNIGPLAVIYDKFVETVKKVLSDETEK
jgi:hypothetical protein